MEELVAWLHGRSPRERAIATLACLALILMLGIDIGRSLYQAVH